MEQFRLPGHLAHNGHTVGNNAQTLSSLLCLHALLKTVKVIKKFPGVE